MIPREFIKGFGAVLLAAFLPVKNIYEGARRWSNNYSYLVQEVVDARFDANSMTRLELTRKARYWEQNSGLVQRLADVWEQYVCGPNGLQFIPASSDEQWNLANTEAFSDWSKYPDIATRSNFGMFQAVCARRWFIDGEVFIVKTNGGPRPDGPPYPRLQMIESHRVATPPNLYPQEGNQIVDGVEIDKRGRPVAYYVRDDSYSPGGYFTGPPAQSVENYRRFPADQVIHLHEPARPGEYRSMTFFHAVMNDLHDLEDLQLMEKRAAKEASEVSNVLTNAAGEEGTEGTIRSRYSVTNQDSVGNVTTEQRQEMVRKIFGARSVALREGEDLKQFVSQRPSVTTQWYWGYLTSKVCAGVGISKLLVFPESTQGTVTRADLDIQNTFFRGRSAVFASAMIEAYLFVTDWNRKNIRACSDAPADWQKVNVRPPRSVNVDIGRNSQAAIAELQAGLRTFEQFYGELGLDWRKELRQKAAEMAYINALAKEFGVEPEDIAASQLAIQAEMNDSLAESQNKKEAIAA